jgi:hypothetical protein
MKHIEYINGIVDMIISDYKHNQENKEITLEGVTYIRPSDEWICQLWYPISEEKRTFDTVSFTTGTPLNEIAKLVHDKMDNINPYK